MGKVPAPPAPAGGFSFASPNINLLQQLPDFIGKFLHRHAEVFLEDALYCLVGDFSRVGASAHYVHHVVDSLGDGVGAAQALGYFVPGHDDVVELLGHLPQALLAFAGAVLHELYAFLHHFCGFGRVYIGRFHGFV